MKKLLMIVVLAIFVGTTAFEAPVKNVSTKIINAFNKQFDNENDVTWVTSGNYTKAIFIENSKQVTAFYDKNDEFIGTAKTFDFDKLPANALETILKKYSFPKYELKECIEYKNAEGEVNYYSSFVKNNRTTILKITPGGMVNFF